jgi:hypothetical protein
MANKDDFRLVLSNSAKLPEPPDTGPARRRAVLSSSILKGSVLVVTAAAIGFAVVLLGNPRALMTSARAFLAGASTPQDGTGQDQNGAGQDQDSTRQEMPTVQSVTDTEAPPPPASDASADNETAPPSDTAAQTENAQAPAQALLTQFQAWAASQDTRAEVQPVQPAPAHEDPAAPAADAQAAASPQDTMPVNPPVQRRQPAARVKNAQAETRAKQNRAKPRPEPNAQLYFRPTQLREPDPPVQTARPPSFLESLRSHN